jgi:hypothetical protein
MLGASKSENHKMSDDKIRVRFTCFSGKRRNNSTSRHVVSMEKTMRQFLGSIKPASCGVIWRHESLSQAAFNMRDYTRI